MKRLWMTHELKDARKWLLLPAEFNFSFSILMNVGAMTARPPWLVKLRLSVQVPGEIGRAHSITCNPLERSRLIEFDSASSCQVSVEHMTWILVSLISCLMTSARVFSERTFNVPNAIWWGGGGGWRCCAGWRGISTRLDCRAASVVCWCLLVMSAPRPSSDEMVVWMGRWMLRPARQPLARRCIPSSRIRSTVTAGGECWPLTCGLNATNWFGVYVKMADGMMQQQDRNVWHWVHEQWKSGLRIYIPITNIMHPWEVSYPTTICTVFATLLYTSFGSLDVREK